jgi:glucose-1-phosphate thymidylyltransferase
LGRPLIEYPIQSLVDAGVRDVGVVIGYKGEMIIERLGGGSQFGARITYIWQKKQLGLAHAINTAIEDGFVKDSFIVHLGDNIVGGGIGKYLQLFLESDSDVHLLLYRVEDPSRFGVAVLRDGRIAKLVEKPREPISNWAVIGVYFFRDPDMVRRANRDLRPSWRGEYEVTDLIQWFINKGSKVTYSIVNSWWIDVGSPSSLLNAVRFLLQDSESRINGKVHGDIEGKVIVKGGAIVEGALRGPAYIGENVIVGEKALVSGYSSVEAGSRILSGSLERSVILTSSTLDLGGSRLVESVIGSHSIIKAVDVHHSSRLKLTLVLSDYSMVEIG